MTDLLNLYKERCAILTAANTDLRAQLAAGQAEAERLRAALEFVWSRVEDNATAWELDNSERGWRATFEYEELARINPATLAHVSEGDV